MRVVFAGTPHYPELLEGPGKSQQLAVLDLQYLQLDGPLNVDSSGNYDITVNNCWFTQGSALNLGCSTNWLVEIATLTNLPLGN